VRNEEIFDSVKEERNIQQTKMGTKTKGIGHIMPRNFIQNTLLKER
jgi:hypothetical protein